MNFVKCKVARKWHGFLRELGAAGGSAGPNDC